MVGSHPKTLVCMIFLVTATFVAHAQKRDSDRNIYIERFPDYFFVWPLIKQRTNQFEIQQATNSANKLAYRPNNSVGMGFGLYVFEVGAELTFAVPLAAERESLYGKTTATDLQLNLLGKNWGLDLFYQNYRGFYVSDPNQKIPAGLPLPQRPDTRTQNLGINGIYAFNKKFSLRSAYNFSERQRKSAGSLMLTGTLNFFDVDMDSAAYGSKYHATLGANNAFDRLNMNTASISPGYSHTFVYKNFFVNGSLSVGPAVHWVDYSVDLRVSTVAVLNSFVDLRIGIGYNGKRFFSGINMVGQARSAKFSGIQFIHASNTVKIVIGYRFNEVGFLKRKASDLLTIIGIHK